MQTALQQHRIQEIFKGFSCVYVRVQQCQWHTFFCCIENITESNPLLWEMNVFVLIHIKADGWEAVSCLTLRWLRTHAFPLFLKRERSYDRHFFCYKKCEWLRINQPEDASLKKCFFFFFKSQTLPFAAGKGIQFRSLCKKVRSISWMEKCFSLQRRSFNHCLQLAFNISWNQRDELPAWFYMWHSCCIF